MSREYSQATSSAQPTHSLRRKLYTYKFAVNVVRHRIGGSHDWRHGAFETSSIFRDICIYRETGIRGRIPISPLFRLCLLNDINLKCKQAFNSEFWFLTFPSARQCDIKWILCSFKSTNYTNDLSCFNYNKTSELIWLNHLYRQIAIVRLLIHCR